MKAKKVYETVENILKGKALDKETQAEWDRKTDLLTPIANFQTEIDDINQMYENGDIDNEEYYEAAYQLRNDIETWWDEIRFWNREIPGYDDALEWVHSWTDKLIA